MARVQRFSHETKERETTMKRLLALAAFCTLPAAALAQHGSHAAAGLQGPDGEEMGTVEFHGTASGILVRVNAMNLPEGPHGLHLHETGACSPDFGAAGGHFAPEGNQHGFLSENGPHAGDLPMIFVSGEGAARADFFTQLVTLDALMDEDGAAVIVHAEPDTYRDPSETGARVACGVIEGM
jgi:Cu-Zn family superoxide dismutase